MVDVAAGPHVLRVVAYDQRGPRFTELCSMVKSLHGREVTAGDGDGLNSRWRTRTEARSIEIPFDTGN